jgi:hypothetical protein
MKLKPSATREGAAIKVRCRLVSSLAVGLATAAAGKDQLFAAQIQARWRLIQKEDVQASN